MSEYTPELDFDVDTDSKAPTFVPVGTYHGEVTNVKFDHEKNAIVWSVCLNDNGGVCTDDQTPIDGAVLTYSNWLPRAGDKETLTKSGRMTKFEAKVNMIKEFAAKMSIDMSTPSIIMESIDNAEWIGASCDVKVDIREWEGSMFNDITKMYAA